MKVLGSFASLATALLLITVSLSCSAASAVQLSPIDQYFLVAFDMELTSRKSVWLVPYFDTEHLEEAINKKGWRSKLLTESVLEDYVLDERAFQALPPQLKERLSQGLNLENRPLILERDSKLLDSRGKSIESDPKKALLLPQQRDIALPKHESQPSDPKLIVKSELALPASTREVPAHSDWPIVNARWKLLPLSEKQAVVSISHLSNQKVAKIIASLPIPGKDPTALTEVLKLRPDAPAWLHELNMSLDFSANTSGRPLEFAPKAPNPDVHQGFQVIQYMLDETRSTAARNQPHKRIEVDQAFHLHLGLTNEAPQKLVQDLEKVLLQYKRLIAIRMLAAGAHNDQILIPKELQDDIAVQTPYDKQLRDRADSQAKGLVRMVDSRHIELREQTASPLETYREFANLLASGHEAATAKVQDELKKLFAADPGIVQRILKHNPKILADFADVLGLDRVQNELRPIFSKRENITVLRSLLQRDPSIENFKFLMELRNSAHPSARAQFEQPYLFYAFNENEATHKFIADYFKSRPSERPIASWKLVMDWAKTSKDMRFDLLRKAKSAEERLHILSALRSNYSLPPRDKHSEASVERARLGTILNELYRDPSTASGLDWLLADDLLKAIQGHSALQNPNLEALLRESIWRPETSSIAIGYFVEKGRLPEELTHGYQGIYQVTDYLTRGNDVELIEEFARSDSKDRKLIVSAIQHLRDLGAPVPKRFIEQLHNSKTSSLPTLRKAAQEFESALESPQTMAPCILKELKKSTNGT